MQEEYEDDQQEDNQTRSKDQQSKKSLFSKGEQSSLRRHTTEQSQDLESIQEGEGSNEKAKRKKKEDKTVLK